jgi:hypothetical protein
MTMQSRSQSRALLDSRLQTRVRHPPLESSKNEWVPPHTENWSLPRVFTILLPNPKTKFLCPLIDWVLASEEMRYFGRQRLAKVSPPLVSSKHAGPFPQNGRSSGSRSHADFTVGADVNRGYPLVSSKRHGNIPGAIALVQPGIAASSVLKARDSRARGATCRARHAAPRGNRTTDKHAESVREVWVHPSLMEPI